MPHDVLQGETASGEVVVSAPGLENHESLPIRIRVNASVPIAEHGDIDVWRMSRIRWLNSRRFHDSITHGLQPIRFQVPVGQDRPATISMTNARVVLSATGLPQQITTFTTGEHHMLTSGATLQIGSGVQWQCADTRFRRPATSSVSWQTLCTSGTLSMKTAGTGWADGYLNVSVTLEQTASNERQKVDDIRLTLPVAAEVAQFAMGLGRPGGFRPRNTTVGWSWGNEIKRQDFMVWLGNTKAGMRLKLRGSDTEYRADNLVTDQEFFDSSATPETAGSSPMEAPLGGIAPWGQEGVGGMRYSEVDQGNTVLLEAYTGARTLEPHTPMVFAFDLAVTPAKPPDVAGHWRRRRIHLNSDWDHDFDRAAGLPSDADFLAALHPIVDAWLATGANTLELHQVRRSTSLRVH